MAAASVGIVSPMTGVASSNRDFTETKEEIQKLLAEDTSLASAVEPRLGHKAVRSIVRR